MCRSKQAAEVTSYSETPPADHSHAAAEAVNKNYFCGSVVNVEDDKPAWYVTLDVEGNPVKFKVDSGADVTVVSEAAYKRLQPEPRLSPNRSLLNSPGGSLSVVGEFVTCTQHREADYSFKVLVVKERTENLLSREVSVKMGLIQHIVAVNFSVLKTDLVHIELKEDAEPSSVYVARRRHSTSSSS